MTLPPAWRKFTLATHLTVSVGWIGGVFAYLALGIAAVTRPDLEIVRGAWVSMELIGWYVLAPLALAALVSGLVLSLGTRWGLFRHYWVLISLLLTVFSTAVLVLHMPTVSATATLTRAMDGGQVSGMGGDLFHPSLGLLVLLLITALNVFKPRGVTVYGWRKQRDERTRLAEARPGSERRLRRVTSPEPAAACHSRAV